MQFSKDAANKIVAPSTSQMMTGPLGFQQFVQQYLSQGDTGRRWSPETINMGLDIAGDPTSYLGLGLFKRLGVEAAARGAPRLVTGALKGAQVADEGASEAMGKVAESLIGLFQKGLIPVNAGLAKQWPELVKWTEYYKHRTDDGPSTPVARTSGLGSPLPPCQRRRRERYHARAG
jgi:hypothetical protein